MEMTSLKNNSGQNYGGENSKRYISTPFLNNVKQSMYDYSLRFLYV